MTDRDQTRSHLESNLNRFVWFRVLYSARFYYPVFTVLFLDYGLTLEQFAILNMVWALTIVIAEVPSGALADLVGRRRLIVFAAALMVVEMAVLVFVPVGASPLLFFAFLVNRICSGVSEAAASGADEALAYDSLKALGREEEWAPLLERTTRMTAIGFFTTMIVGALAYDANVVNAVIGTLFSGASLPETLIIKLPVLLTGLSALLLVPITLGLRELPRDETAEVQKASGVTFMKRLAQPFVQILAAGRWTVAHRFVLFIILAALVLDSVARQFVVLASEYYRVIDIPPAWWGFIGAGMALIGILNARFARHLVTHHTPFFNFSLLAAVLMLGLLGITLVIPWFGVLFAIAAFAMMGLVNFQSSFYINREVDSGHRATVLSFRGLALNLGLGLASLLYTAFIAVLRTQTSADAADIQEVIFVGSLKAFPIYFLVLVLLLLLAGRLLVRKPGQFFSLPRNVARREVEPY